MENTNPASGTAPGLPATEITLDKYLADMQDRACRLSGVMNAIAFLENEERCDEGKAALIYLAEELATDLYGALDCTRIPKGELS